MKGKYIAAFIIPKDAKKALSDDGWQFESPNRISIALKDYLVRALNLNAFESYLGIDSYVGENIKMSVFFDDDKKIENIYFQLHDDSLAVLKQIFMKDILNSEAEIFIPQESA